MPKNNARSNGFKARIVLAIAALACACSAHAQSTDPVIRAAIEAAERGEANTALASQHPLSGWVEYARLRHDIDTLSNAQGQSFLSRYQGQAAGEAFRELWLAALSRRQDWPAFRAAWKPLPSNNLDDSETLRCAYLNARQATGAMDAAWTGDAQALWRGTVKALPAVCDAPFAILASQGGLPPALRWERIEKAAAEWQPAVMRSAARGLPAEEFALANDYAAFFDATTPLAPS